VEGRSNAAGNVAGCQGDADRSASVPAGTAYTVSGDRFDGIDFHDVRPGGLGIAGRIHAPEGDVVDAFPRDGEDAAGVGLLRAAVDGEVRGCYSAGGIAGRQGDADRGASEPAVIAWRARETLGGEWF